MDFQDYTQLNEAIQKRNSIRGALFFLKSSMPEFAQCDLGYEYFVRKNAYIRGDLIEETTLPREITNLYQPSGGQNADPIVENIADMGRSLKVDLKQLTHDKASKYYKNAFFEGLQAHRCTAITAYKFLPPEDHGFGALTLMQQADYPENPPPKSFFIDVGYALHTILKRHGFIKNFLGITEAEHFVLVKMAEGKTAHDVAYELAVTTRTIEMRLQSARKKLKARTTTEAVYKSVCYGII